ALLPLMLGLIATFGQVLSVSFFHPIIIFLIHVSGLLMTSFVFPLLFLSALLMIVSHMNEKYQATYLADLFKHISLGTLGVFITIFLGVISIQGTATAIQDGVALKTTKFITGNFVPVIGRSFTEAADTVLSAALLLKNAIGIFGLIIIISIAVFPLVKITVIAIMYKLAAALLQPLGSNSTTTSLNKNSKYMMYILACLIVVTYMFVLAIVLMIVTSNFSFLFRYGECYVFVYRMGYAYCCVYFYWNYFRFNHSQSIDEKICTYCSRPYFIINFNKTNTVCLSRAYSKCHKQDRNS